MYWVAQAWDEATSSVLLADSLMGKRVPLLIGLWELARDGCLQYGANRYSGWLRSNIQSVL